jgi:hypothetical protein
VSILQIFRDWRHERYIHRLSRAVREAYEAGNRARAHAFDDLRMTAIMRRSPSQVTRMERRMGLR